jgi:predicted short-subunit dehydrogenase-like oxidoreductase (DUF2520 family)
MKRAVELDSVLVLGSGKVGRTLAAALRRAARPVTLLPARRRLPRRLDAALLVLCVRDGALPELARALRGRVSARAAVVHVAGALGPSVLEALRGHCAGIGQAHPLLSFASARVQPALEGAHLLVAGDRVAVTRARAMARALGMVPRAWPGVELPLYHAAGGLLANGSAALAESAARLLVSAGCPERDVGRVLGPLLRSVADNVVRLGTSRALTGPIRRGDAGTVRAHVAALERRAPEVLALYLACARAQLPVARALREASPAALREIEAVLLAANRRMMRVRV